MNEFGQQPRHLGTGGMRSWFMGLNPDLEDRAAATILRDGDIEAVGPVVLRAARAFIAGG